MEVALRFVADGEIRVSVGEHSPIDLHLPNPKVPQYWSQRLHKDQNWLITISAQTTTLGLEPNQVTVTMGSITVADTETLARLASWTIVSDPNDGSQWMQTTFPPQTTQREIAEIIGASTPKAIINA